MKTSSFDARAVYDVISVKLAELPTFPENVRKYPLLAERYAHNYTREHLLKAVNQLSVYKFAEEKPGQLNLELRGNLNVVSVLNADNIVDALVLLVTNMRSVVDVAKVVIAQKNLAELAQWSSCSWALSGYKERDFRVGIVECVAIAAVHYWSQVRSLAREQNTSTVQSALHWVSNLASIDFSELPRTARDSLLVETFVGIRHINDIRPTVEKMLYGSDTELATEKCSSQFLGALISLFKCETLQGAALKKGIQDAMITWINFDETFVAPFRGQQPAVSQTVGTAPQVAPSTTPAMQATNSVAGQMSPRAVNYLVNNADKVRAELAKIAEDQASPEMAEILKAMSALYLKDL